MVNINAETQVYGLLGHPVNHSLSPLIHNFAFNQNDLNAVYTAFDTTDIENAVKGIKALGIRGVSVTVPHKENIIGYLDDLTPIARKIGSVNTVSYVNGSLIGTNTDAEGFYQALAEKVSVKGKKIAVFGSGGAARAVIFALLEYSEPSGIVILARNEHKRKELFLNIQQYFSDVDLSEEPLESWKQFRKETDILIHTTTVGMIPGDEDSLLDSEDIPEGIAVMDIVYRPHETKLIREAKKKNAEIVYGIDMLYFQAVRQFEFWTGEKAPEKELREAVYRFISGEK